jgi:tetratricopeptide (TPR) repeat protein
VRAESLQSRLSTWLLRPYLDLGPANLGPLHVGAVEQCWRALVEPQRPPFVAQRALPPAFRAQLGAEAGGSPYLVRDPRELPEPYRTDRWRTLCEALDGWNDRPADARCRIASLLHSMCLYGPLLALIPETGVDSWAADAHAIELAFWRASAAFMAGVRQRIADYAAADLGVFEHIARHARDVMPLAFNATAIVFVHKAKTGAPMEDVAAWGKRFEDAAVRATGGADDFTAKLYTSRFYRGIGFLPQRRGDRGETVRVMALAEHHATSMTPTTPAEAVLCGENRHAVMESRTKEALWLGDVEQALARALSVVEVDPYDSKAWVELGEVRFRRREWREAAQAYAVAAMLGPPGAAVARHMTGVCLRELGDDLLAAVFFKDTVELDPLGISPREEIHRLPDLPALAALKEWSLGTEASPGA